MITWQCPHCKKFDLIVCEQTPVLENPSRRQLSMMQMEEWEYICVGCLKVWKHNELSGTMSPDALGIHFEPSDVVFIMDEW
jgi:hypothetical protein